MHNNTDLPPYNNLPKHTADGSGMHRSTAHSEDTTKKKDASLKDLEAYLLQDCSAAEADHRRKTLQAIEEKLRHEPYHSAADHPDRARQFMPLKDTMPSLNKRQQAQPLLSKNIPAIYPKPNGQMTLMPA